MTDLELRGRDGGTLTGAADDLERLRGSLGGPLCLANDDGYEDGCRIWNGQIGRRPAAVVRASGTADVIDTVNFARDRGLALSVKGNGHNVAGLALVDGGLCLDLTAMRGIHLDPASRIMRVQPGCNWRDADREGQAFGLAVPGGAVSTTGVSGLVLGGGFGWVTRKYGLTSDNLLSADVVTADGRLLTASPDENADLFWAICGGGGNFGVVTSFEFRAQPVGPEVTGGLILWPIDQAQEVGRLYREVSDGADDDFCAALVMRLAPPAPFVPEAMHGKPVVGIVLCHIGAEDAAAKAVAPIRGFGEPLADVITRVPFTGQQTLFDASFPYGRRYYWKSDYFDAINDDMVAIMADHSARPTSPHSSLLFFQLGGAAARLAADHSAAGNRSANYILNINAAWEAPPDEHHIAWARDFWQDLHPHSTGGVYVNFMTEDEDDSRVEAAYGTALLNQLAAVKAKYDPGNLFQVNQNIRPAA